MLAVPAAILLAALAGCAPDPSQRPADGGSVSDFAVGDFRVMEIPPEDRGEAVEFAGTTEYGDAVSSDDFRGNVLVVNFWYAACGPCIAEAPMLEEVWQEYQDDGVAFLGVNGYDQPSTAISFARDNGITYPSVIDVGDGAVKLAFARVTPVQATPTTLVLDRDGRVAARVIGQLEGASILSTLVEGVLEESK